MIVCAATVAALACPPIVPPVPLPAAPSGPAPGPTEVAEDAGPPTDDAPSSASTSATTPTCTASWYGDELAGSLQANGVPFDPAAHTVAAWDYPLGAVLEVHHQGASVVVEVTDRGPARRLDRCLDLSEAAFAQLAPTGAGLIDVTYEVIR